MKSFKLKTFIGILIVAVLVPFVTLEARERGDRSHPTDRPTHEEPAPLPTPEPTPDPEPPVEPTIIPLELLERWKAMQEEGLTEEVEEEYRAFVEVGIYPTDPEEPDPEDPPTDEPSDECSEDGGETEASDRIRNRVIHRDRGGNTNPIVTNCDEEEEEQVEEEPPVAEEEEESDDGDFEATFEEKFAAEIHRLSNIERGKEELPSLVHDSALQQIAEKHSEDMAENSYFSHTNLQNCDLSCRIDEAEYEASSWGENIAWRSSTVLPSAEEIALMFVVSWMNSSGHRDNILSDSFTNVGIGIAKVGNTVFATVDFAIN